jgi:1-aminocyclopropane-1-carboxylate deaminase
MDAVGERDLVTSGNSILSRTFGANCADMVTVAHTPSSDQTLGALWLDLWSATIGIVISNSVRFFATGLSTVSVTTAGLILERTVALSDFPRYPLLFGPSPVHPLDRLSAHLGGARIWAKREDCNSGLAFGGNKTRKLEYLVPDALAQGATHLVSIGGVQSNHTRQVAAVAAKLGLKARLVQESWVDWPDSVNDRVGNILLSRVMGADVQLVESGFGIGFKQSWENALEEIRAERGVPYAIPAGASDHRLGGLGFANWADEVRQQEEELGVFFDTIVVCSVTGSTHAGMIAGFAGQERPRRILGIDASAKIDETRAQVEKIARNTADLIDLGRDLREDEITVLEGWAGDYYGIPVASTLDAIRLTGRLEGVILDPVYEGKSMAALIDLVRDGDIAADSNVLYAHLGGQPALNAYSALFKN